MKKSQCSAEDKIIDNAALEMTQLVEDYYLMADEIKSMLHDAFDYSKPERYPNIIEDAQVVLSPVLNDIKGKCDEFKQRYGID